jgi:SAM-dependent methyltransferase
MDKENDILAGARLYMKSRVILTAAELDLFTQLHGSPASADELARRNGLALKGTTRVLDCLVGFGLMTKKDDGRYYLSEEASILSSNHPRTVLPMILHLNHLWDTWGHLTETVKNGNNPKRKPITERGDETLGAFIGAMDVVGRDLAKEIAKAYDASPFKSLLDIGGASGTYTAAFLSRYPHLKAVLFDLEDVIPMATERLEAQGLLSRVQLVAGNFYADELPGGCDLALLSAIIHQNGPDQNLELYRKVHRALAPGGVLLIRDHIMDDSRTWPPAGTVFAINMLVGTGHGDTYTLQEVKDTLERAGFSDVKLVRRGENMDCLVEARKR